MKGMIKSMGSSILHVYLYDILTDIKLAGERNTFFLKVQGNYTQTLSV